MSLRTRLPDEPPGSCLLLAGLWVGVPLLMALLCYPILLLLHTVGQFFFPSFF